MYIFIAKKKCETTSVAVKSISSVYLVEILWFTQIYWGKRKAENIYIQYVYTYIHLYI